MGIGAPFGNADSPQDAGDQHQFQGARRKVLGRNPDPGGNVALRKELGTDPFDDQIDASLADTTAGIVLEVGGDPGEGAGLGPVHFQGMDGKTGAFVRQAKIIQTRRCLCGKPDIRGGLLLGPFLGLLLRPAPLFLLVCHALAPGMKGHA